MMKEFLSKTNIQKNKKFILLGCLALILTIFTFSYFSKPVKNTAKEEMVFTIPAMGQLPDLHVAMKENSALDRKVKELIAYDAASLFILYPQVNTTIMEIMFLWIGLTPQQIEQKNKQQLAEHFIRRVYNLPSDEPIAGNPLLEKKPWAGLFKKIKAKLLMQGNGHKVFDGVAYYDSNKDKMVIEGGLSTTFATHLATYLQQIPTDKHKKYINNYLSFIDNTLGLKNLHNNEKKLLKNLGFL